MARNWVLLLLVLAGLGLALHHLARIAPSEAPTIEQILAPAQVAEIERMRGIFGSEPEFVIVTVQAREGRLPEDRVRLLEADLGGVRGVERTWSSRAGEAGRASFLRPDASTAIMLLALEPGATRLTRARELTAAIDSALARRAAPEESVHVVGTPQLRVASWEAAEADLRRMLPYLTLVVIAVPLLFFGALGAILFPLLLAALTTVLTLLAYRIFHGPLNTLVLLLVPLLWSVATLDAMHLYSRVRREAARPRPDPIALAKAELRVPCLLTTLTTAGGLLALAAQGESRLLRHFGIWGALGSCIAYVLTFTLGGTLLSLSSSTRPPTRWPSRLALRTVRVSTGHPRLVLLGWAGLLCAAALQCAHLQVEVRFPRVFRADHPMARELAAVETLLGSNLAPLEIYVEPMDEAGRDPAALAAAALTTSSYVGTLPETRALLPRDLLRAEQIEIAPGTMREQLARLGEDPRMAPWIRFGSGVARLQVFFAPMSYARSRELFGWLVHFDATMLDHHRLTLGGPGYTYLQAERSGLRGTALGAALTLIVVLAGLGWAFRRATVFAAALLGNLAPVLLAAGLMGALHIPWSLALLPLPAVLLGLAVDDTFHLLWPLRGRRAALRRPVQRGALLSGPAVVATTTVLAACVGTMSLSGLEANRELGLLLPAGLSFALLCDLSLVPALITTFRRRSTRRPR